MKPNVNNNRRLSLVAPCAFACMLVLVLVYVSAGSENLLPRVGSVFFVEPFYGASLLGKKGAVAFLAWLLVAGVIAKARQQNRRFRPAALVLLPAFSIYVFNAFFDVGAAPIVEPTAIVAVIGVLLYEAAFAHNWSRLVMAAVTFVACASYGAGTLLGLWGSLVAAGAMTAAQLTWSGMELNLFRLTATLRGRKFEYR